MVGTCAMLPVCSHAESGSMPLGVGSAGFRMEVVLLVIAMDCNV